MSIEKVWKDIPQQMIAAYVCDTCGKTLRYEDKTGAHAVLQVTVRDVPGWARISMDNHKEFCSWRCLTDFKRTRANQPYGWPSALWKK